MKLEYKGPVTQDDINEIKPPRVSQCTPTPKGKVFLINILNFILSFLETIVYRIDNVLDDLTAVK